MQAASQTVLPPASCSGCAWQCICLQHSRCASPCQAPIRTTVSPTQTLRCSHPKHVSFSGLSPYQPSYGTSVGSCGFGLLARNQYPFWAVGALSTSNHYFLNEPQQACGECFEVPC
jgi:hypothetical protein